MSDFDPYYQLSRELSVMRNNFDQLSKCGDDRYGRYGLSTTLTFMFSVG